MQGYRSETAKTATRVTTTQDSVLRTRVISAVFIGFVTILTGLLGGTWFSGLVLLAIGVATYEVVTLMRASGFQPTLAFCIASAVLMFVAIRLPAIPFLPLLVSILLLGSLTIQMRHRGGKPIADWAIAIAGGAYLGWTGGHLAAVRELDNGVW